MAFGNAKMLRKMAFHYVLAGDRFFKATQEILALECYKTALREYSQKRWFFAEVLKFLLAFKDTLNANSSFPKAYMSKIFQDSILYTLARDSRSLDLALEYSEELFRPTSVQCEEQQQQFFSIFLELMVRRCGPNSVSLTLPVTVIVAKLVYVVYGNVSEQAVRELVGEASDVVGIDPNIY